MIGKTKEIVDSAKIAREMGEDYIAEDSLCKDCGNEQDKCHQVLFGNYCIAHLCRRIQPYPAAMSNESATRLYIRKYNAALHFYTVEKDGDIPRRSFVLPPRCMEREMNCVLEFIRNQHSTYVNGELNVYREWVETAMNFDGLDMMDE